MDQGWPLEVVTAEVPAALVVVLLLLAHTRSVFSGEARGSLQFLVLPRSLSLIDIKWECMRVFAKCGSCCNLLVCQADLDAVEFFSGNRSVTMGLRSPGAQFACTAVVPKTLSLCSGGRYLVLLSVSSRGRVCGQSALT